MEQKNDKKFVVLKIITCESGSRNSDILEQDTSDWQSGFYEATLTFKISQGEVYSKPGSIRVLKNIMKVLSRRFYQSFGPFNVLTVKGCSETLLFREWSNEVFDSL